jgi:hypothetical protein
MDITRIKVFENVANSLLRSSHFCLTSVKYCPYYTAVIHSGVQNVAIVC